VLRALKSALADRVRAAVSLAHSRVLRLGVRRSVISLYLSPSLPCALSLARSARAFSIPLTPSPFLRLVCPTCVRVSRVPPRHTHPDSLLFLDHRAIDVTSRRAVKPCSLSCLSRYPRLRVAPRLSGIASAESAREEIQPCAVRVHGVRATVRADGNVFVSTYPEAALSPLSALFLPRLSLSLSLSRSLCLSLSLPLSPLAPPVPCAPSSTSSSFLPPLVFLSLAPVSLPFGRDDRRMHDNAATTIVVAVVCSCAPFVVPVATFLRAVRVRTVIVESRDE